MNWCSTCQHEMKNCVCQRTAGLPDWPPQPIDEIDPGPNWRAETQERNHG